VQNFNIGQRSPLFDKFQPKYPPPLLPVQTSTDAFRRYKELAGLSVMQHPLALGPLCLHIPTKSYLLQCVITFKDRSLDLIAPHAHGLAALMLVNDAYSAPSSLCLCMCSQVAGNTCLQVVCRLGKLPLPTHPFSKIIYDAAAGGAAKSLSP
jgi:hypothetical protein